MAHVVVPRCSCSRQDASSGPQSAARPGAKPHHARDGVADEAALEQTDREAGQNDNQFVDRPCEVVVDQVVDQPGLACAYRGVDQSRRIGVDNRGERAGREQGRPELGQRLRAVDVGVAHRGFNSEDHRAWAE